jgi:hypothetical protein
MLDKEWFYKLIKNYILQFLLIKISNFDWLKGDA